MKRALIIERDRLRREQAMEELRPYTEQIHGAATVSDAVCLLGTSVSDFVLLSIPRLDQSGFAVVHRATQLSPQSRVLAVTTIVAVEYIRDTCIGAYRVSADLGSPVRELFTLFKQDIWIDECPHMEVPCAPPRLLQQS